MDVTITFIFLFLVFALIHSLLATDYIKNNANKFLEDKFRFYRITYNIISLLTFAPVLMIWVKYTALTPLLYSVPQFLYPVFLLIRLLAIGMFVYATFQTDILEFLGIRQIRGRDNSILITRGAYGIVRHPLYTGSIILLFTKMNMSQLDLVAFVLISIYLIIGAYIEEKRLLGIFEEEYRKYQRQVSMFIPVKWIMKLKSNIVNKV